MPYHDSKSLGISVVKSSNFLLGPSRCAHRTSGGRGTYFLPDFLMPWEPVLRGPLPLPTLPASSSRAFLSGGCVSLFCVDSLLCEDVGRWASGTHQQRAWPCGRDRPRRALVPSSWASCCGWGLYRLRRVSLVLRHDAFTPLDARVWRRRTSLSGRHVGDLCGVVGCGGGLWVVGVSVEAWIGGSLRAVRKRVWLADAWGRDACKKSGMSHEVWRCSVTCSDGRSSRPCRTSSRR